MKKGLSIVICTYNGATLLPATLRHIARQRVPADLPWELILVDNASTDNVAEVAVAEWATQVLKAPMRVLKQPVPGLNAARELGFAHARYAYIVLCDDDNWLADDYLATAFESMERNPAIGMLGGQGDFAYETPPPDWVVAHPIHAGGPQAPASGKTPHHGLYGAGSIMRQSAYQAIRQAGFQFRLTDRLGSRLSSGGDFELCHALALAGYLIWYDDRLRFTHFLTANRITWTYYINYLNENARSFTVLEPYGILLDRMAPGRRVFWGALLTNFFGYLASFLYTSLKKSWVAHSRMDSQLRELKLITLKARLRSYRQCVGMSRNFVAATKFQQQCRQQGLAEQNAPGITTVSRETA